MSSQHEDSASTITVSAARELLERATPRGRRLLELFARRQILRLNELKAEFETTQNGLNALLGRLTQNFQEIRAMPGFYIYLEELGAWAVGHATVRNLRQALREVDRARQKRISFS